MSRVYIQASWVNAAADWSGDSPDNRKCSSQELFLPNGKANTELFSDNALKAPTKPKVKRSAFEQATLADTRLDRLQKLSDALDEDYENDKISFEQWQYAKDCLKPRIQRAWKQIDKTRRWENEEIYQNEIADRNVSPNVCLKEGEKSDSIFLSLKEQNVFRKIYVVLNKITKTVDKIIKEI